MSRKYNHTHADALRRSIGNQGALTEEAKERMLGLLDAVMATVQVPTGERYFHEKRGTTYDVLGFGHANSAHMRAVAEESVTDFEDGVAGWALSGEKILFDRDEVVVYRDVQTGAISVRSIKEFADGRFTLLPSAAGGAGLDPARTLAAALGQAPAPTAPAPAPVKLSTLMAAHDTLPRLEFDLHGHIMRGKRGQALEYDGAGKVKVQWDDVDEPSWVDTLNTKVVD